MPDFLTMTARVHIAALLTVLVAGCSAIVSDVPTNRCTSEDDCATGSCDAERGMCVSAPSDPLLIGLEVMPASDPIYRGSPRTFDFEPFPLTESGTRNLVLQPGIPVLGIAADGFDQPITADISFTTPSRIPGVASSTVSAQARAETMRDERDPGVFEYNFATQLLAGRVHSVTVRPTGEWASRLPPLRAMYMSPEAESHRLELRYPQPCSAAVMNDPTSTEACLATIQGFVRDGAGGPVDGVSVRVVDPVSGQTLSSTFTTGSGTDPVAGRFEVVLPIERWRDLEGWLFRVTPTASRTEEHGASQSFTVAPSALYEDDFGVVTILTPEIPDVVNYAGWVEGPDGTPVVGATLQFTSRDVVDETTGAIGSFTTTTTTQGDPEACRHGTGEDCGLFEVTLLAGTYDTVVTPGPGDSTGSSSLAVLYAEERRIDPERPTDLAPTEHIPVMGQLFVLPRRAPVFGNVQTAEAMAMVDAVVRAQARGTDLGGELPSVARYARSNMSSTNSSGQFSVDLDVGVYDLFIEPPEGSNYPWIVDPDQPIASDARLSDVYEFRNPVLVSGVAQFQNPDADGPATIPVANGEVRAYAVIETPDGGTRAVQIGRASTDMDGNYTLLLPPSL